MKVAFDMSGYRNRLAKELKKAMAEEQTKRLLEYAPKMLNLAYNERTFRNDTFNLADSYVWVVYYNGVPQGSGYLWNGRVATQDANYHHTKVNGRVLAQAFVTRYVSNTKGWEVVWAATAPYSTYLESGTSRGRFYVITSIYDKIVSDFNGNAKVSKIINY
mgnify:FL=1